MDLRSHAVSNAQWVVDRGLRRKATAVEAPQQVIPHPQPAATPVVVEQKAIQDNAEPRFSITPLASTVLAITGQELRLWQTSSLGPGYGAVIDVGTPSTITTAIHSDKLANAAFSFTGFDPQKSNMVLEQVEQPPKFEIKPWDTLIAKRMSNRISALAKETDEFIELSKMYTSVETALLAQI